MKKSNETTLWQIIAAILLSLIAFTGSVIALSRDMVSITILGAVLGVIYIIVSYKNIKSYKLNKKSM